MNASGDIISWLVIGGSLATIFLGCAVVIKKFFIDKKYFGAGQFIGRQIYSEFQNADRKKSIEHVIYMEEEERRQDFSSEGDHDSRR